MPNPRITIETFLGKIPPNQVGQVRKQLLDLNKGFKGMATASTASSRTIERDMDRVKLALKRGNREFAINSVRTLAMRQGFESVSQAGKAFQIILRDMFSAVGFLNTAMSIMLSRFGTMILIFGVITMFKKLSVAIKDAERRFDTASRKLRGIVVPTFGTLSDAMVTLELRMLNFTAQYGTSIGQLSDTMFFLASAGRSHVQILNEVIAVQKLVTATSKDMNASNQDNKVLVESFVGLLNLYGEAIKEVATEQERAEHLASIMFAVFKSEQILITELASGLSFSAQAAKALNLGIEELVVIIGALNTAMLKGSKAGTSLSNALRDTLKNSAKLKENFGIDIGNVADGFSLLEDVIRPINERMKETANLTQFNVLLMESYNRRGGRAILALTNDVEENIIKVQDLKIANDDLARAFDANADSIVQQEQRIKNLKDIFALMFATVVTGGRGHGATLKQVANNTELFTRLSAFLTFQILKQTAAQRSQYEIQLLQWQAYLRTIPVIGKYVKKLISARDITKGMIRANEQAIIWQKFANHEITEYEAQQQLANLQTKDANELANIQIQNLKALTSLWGTYTKSLNDNIKIVDKFGDIDFDRITKALAGDKTLFAKFSATSLVSNEEIEAFLKNILDNVNFFELTFAEKERNIFERMIDSVRKATQDADKEILKLVGDEKQKAAAILRINTELQIKNASIVVKGEEERRKLVKASFKEQLKITKDGNNAIIKANRDAIKLSSITIGGVPATEFIERGGPLGDLSDIVIKPKIDETALKELAKVNELILAEVAEKLNELRSDQLKLSVIETKAVFRDVESGNLTVGVSRTFDPGGLRDITKVERAELLAVRDSYNDMIRDIIARSLAGNKEITDSNIARSEQAIAANRAEQNAIINKALGEGRLLTGDEEDQLRELENSSASLFASITEASIKAFQEMNKSIDSETSKAGVSIDANIRSKTDKAGESGSKLDKILKQAFQDAQSLLSSRAEAFDLVSETIRTLAELTGDKQKQQLASLLSTTTSTVSGLISVWSDYQRVLESTENAAVESAAKLTATLGIMGLLISATVAIVNLFKDEPEERNQLQQEFVDTDSARAVSPDYGQARVVNNRITLVPTFQLLDASQLTADTQRRLALTIFDELKEIEKTYG